MKKALFLALAITAGSGGLALADARTACRADAQKLCASSIGNQQQVAACLKANADKISDGCKKALAAL